MKWRASLVATNWAVARARHVAQHRHALPEAVVAVARAEHHLGAGLVQLGPEQELSGHAAAKAAALAADRPAAQHRGEGGDVGLRVAAADAEGVQLEDLA